MQTKIAPSILSADFSRLGEEIKKIEESGADYIHIDVMDGHFVPNITIGPLVVQSIRNLTNLTFDVHLMIENPSEYIENFAEAGADIITVHAESCIHLNRVVQQIKQLGKKVGVALNPATPLSFLDYILEDLDMVLLMTVNPGFGGQSYVENVTQKIKDLRSISEKRGFNIDIQVDGGISLSNVNVVKEAGANIIVSGSAFFKAQDSKAFVKGLKE